MNSLPSLLTFCALVLSVSPPAATAADTFDQPSLAPAPGQRAFQPQPPPPGADLRLELIASGLEQPIYVTAPPGGPQLFLVERTGKIRVIENGEARAEPFLDLSGRVDWAGERGLLGLAFAPDYAESGRFYVAYSEHETFATVVTRFRAHVRDARAEASSGEEILRIEQTPERIDHKAGWIGFRPGEPRYLYIFSGDGGGHNDPDNVAQNLQDRRGKILRVDVSGDRPGFTVPKGNPFVGRADALPEIWARGVRNPFRASFDRDTGGLFFGDVGQDAREEVNHEPAGTSGGRNYGWRLREGSRRSNPDDALVPEGFTAPLLEYAHEQMMFARGCVIGGYVYRGTALPELNGAYFFADFTNARIYSLRETGGTVELTDWSWQLNRGDEELSYSGLVSFGEDAAGELFVVDFAGALFKVVRATSSPGASSRPALTEHAGAG